MERVCCVCGSQGFSVALIDCHKCDNLYIHRYCLRNIPEDINEYVAWICDDCEPPAAETLSVIEPESLLLEKDESTCTKDMQESLKEPMDVQESSEEPKVAEPLSMILPDSVSAKEVQDSAFDIDYNVTLISLLKKKKKRKFTNVQSCQGGKVAEVRSSGKSKSCSENFGEDQESKKRKLTPIDGEKNCVEEDNAQNDHESEGAKGVEKGLSGESQMLVLVDGEHCKGACELPKVRHEQSENNQEIESGEEMGLALVCGRNLSNIIESEKHGLDDKGTNASVNMLQQGYIVCAQPIVDPVWKGQFGILNERYGTIDRISAYLSSLACKKVHSAAKFLPGCLSLDLLPRTNIWPKGFEGSRPTDFNIGLYFFPDNERDEKDYETLINDMLYDDLAMKVVLESAELLIFTSTQLPIERWRFRSKFYLWGVFRRRQESHSGKNEITGGNRPIPAVPLRMQSPVSPLQR